MQRMVFKACHSRVDMKMKKLEVKARLREECTKLVALVNDYLGKAGSKSSINELRAYVCIEMEEAISEKDVFFVYKQITGANLEGELKIAQDGCYDSK